MATVELTWQELVAAARDRAIVSLDDGRMGVLVWYPAPIERRRPRADGRKASKGGARAKVKIAGSHIAVDPASIVHVYPTPTGAP